MHIAPPKTSPPAVSFPPFASPGALSDLFNTHPPGSYTQTLSGCDYVFQDVVDSDLSDMQALHPGDPLPTTFEVMWLRWSQSTAVEAGRKLKKVVTLRRSLFRDGMVSECVLCVVLEEGMS